MCGIVGYIGHKNTASEILLNSLQILEYRGYDSAGIAVMQDNNLTAVKTEGKLINLKNKVSETTLTGNVGIGHTRWATHGQPSDANAHPHTSNNKKITIVHNGIINNYLELKELLISKYNIQFHSETDTEVIANLLAVRQEELGGILPAVRQVIKELDGSYALCVMTPDVSDQVILVSKSAPLVIGFDTEHQELYCASDSAALLPYTKRIIRLKDYEIAVLTYHQQSQQVNLDLFQAQSTELHDYHSLIQTLTGDTQVLDKQGYKHYLLKEIHEQPAILRKLYSYHFDNNNNLRFPDLDSSILQGINKILVVGCGTAYYAGLIGKFLIETLAKIPVEIELASELLARPNLLIDNKTLLIAVSQSGETADTLMAVEKAQAAGAKILAINNRPDSTLANIAKNSCIFTQAGIEVSVAATKSLTAQIFCLFILAIHLSELNSAYDQESLDWLKSELHYQPHIIEQVLPRAEEFKKAIIPYASKKAFIFLGRGVGYALALEGALKLKELTYVQATGYAAGEMKHGPIATLDAEIVTVSMLLESPTYHKTLHNMLEAKTRGSQNIGIILDGDKEAEYELCSKMYLPKYYKQDINNNLLKELLSPFVSLLPLQFMAYYLAEYMGKDVDQPRNLAKSVTVE